MALAAEVRAARRALLPHAAPSAPALAAGCAALAGATLAALAVPVLLRRIIDGVMLGGEVTGGPAALILLGGSGSGAGGGGVGDDGGDAALAPRRVAYRNAALAALLFALRHVLSFAGHVLLRFAAEASVGRLRAAALSRARRLPLRALAAAGQGRVAAVLASDAEAFRELLDDGLNKVTHASVYAIGGLALCFRIDAPLTLAVACCAAAVGAAGRSLAPARRDAAAAAAAAAGEAAALAAEGLAAPRLVKAFGAEDAEAARYDAARARALAAAQRAAVAEQIAANVVQCLGRLVLCAVIAAGALRVRSGALSAGDLVSFSYYCLEVGGAVDKLVAQVGKVYAALGVSRRVVELLEAPAEFEGEDGALLAYEPLWADGTVGVGAQPAVEFDDVRFHYSAWDAVDGFSLGAADGATGRASSMAESPKSPAVLHGVSFAVRRGEVVSLVGNSGCGKSTLLDMVARFVEPVGGAVYVDGVDVRRANPRELRASIGWVQQGIALMRGTVADNIRFGAPADTPIEAVVAAAEAAGAAGFIGELEGGYDHVVSREGGGLSGGQSARVAVARALLRKPRLLLLDEPTSALDAVSEGALVESLLARCRAEGITVLMVHHRVAAARHADRIVVLRGGSVAQQGSHAQLLARGGPYADMCAAQGVRD